MPLLAAFGQLYGKFRKDGMLAVHQYRGSIYIAFYANFGLWEIHYQSKLNITFQGGSTFISNQICTKFCKVHIVFESLLVSLQLNLFSEIFSLLMNNCSVHFGLVSSSNLKSSVQDLIIGAYIGYNSNNVGTNNEQSFGILTLKSLQEKKINSATKSQQLPTHSFLQREFLNRMKTVLTCCRNR
ncbi:hypothetical protein EGR_10589 [Echinococcus granulosus]|uniref:Uncharacterized protein n=1 Tax=Echinococcus granulosus TaxID=6210 RepID=W6U821_ECHGR|nr:hypothetical protein EGR_10589 [Echinococcus granulosus]EUB54547.1 hypothetical protein EGR_10589 [Echinococcus granulosus]